MQIRTCLISLGPFGEVKEDPRFSLEKSPSRIRLPSTGFKYIQVGVLFKLNIQYEIQVYMTVQCFQQVILQPIKINVIGQLKTTSLASEN